MTFTIAKFCPVDTDVDTKAMRASAPLIPVWGAAACCVQTAAVDWRICCKLEIKKMEWTNPAHRREALNQHHSTCCLLSSF